MRAIFTSLLLAAMLAMTGCSIKQTVTPASLSPDLPSEICLIPAEGLRPGFNTTYTALLKNKGLQTLELTPGSSSSACALSTTYIGTWSWDLALYMSYADIRVFENGRQVSQAEYDSRWGGGRLDKFIDAETKTTEPTNKFFPHAPKKLIAEVTTSPSTIQQKILSAKTSRIFYAKKLLPGLTKKLKPVHNPITNSEHET